MCHSGVGGPEWPSMLLNHSSVNILAHPTRSALVHSPSDKVSYSPSQQRLHAHSQHAQRLRTHPANTPSACVLTQPTRPARACIHPAKTGSQCANSPAHTYPANTPGLAYSPTQPTRPARLRKLTRLVCKVVGRGRLRVVGCLPNVVCAHLRASTH
jgi:hypothetical protein